MSMRATRLASAVLAVGIVSAVHTAVAAGASNQVPQRQKVVCSPSGDTCVGIYSRKGTIVIRRTYAEQYEKQTRLCLRYPGTQVFCKTVAVRRAKVWAAQAVFPMQDPGTYSVVGVAGARIRVTV